MTDAGPLHRQTAIYLQGLRGRLLAANVSRKSWLSEVGLLLKDLQFGTSMDIIAAVAGRCGESQGDAFRRIRGDVSALDPAAGCEGCQESVVAWLDLQISACDLLVEIGRTREVERLREVQGLIAEARHEARRFTYEIAERLAVLRHRVHAAKQHRRERTPQTVRRSHPDTARHGRRASMGHRAPTLLARLARLLGFNIMHRVPTAI